jgi:hypothetical protein
LNGKIGSSIVGEKEFDRQSIFALKSFAEAG